MPVKRRESLTNISRHSRSHSGNTELNWSTIQIKHKCGFGGMSQDSSTLSLVPGKRVRPRHEIFDLQGTCCPTSYPPQSTSLEHTELVATMPKRLTICRQPILRPNMRMRRDSPCCEGEKHFNADKNAKRFFFSGNTTTCRSATANGVPPWAEVSNIKHYLAIPLKFCSIVDNSEFVSRLDYPAGFLLRLFQLGSFLLPLSIQMICLNDHQKLGMTAAFKAVSVAEGFDEALVSEVHIYKSGQRLCKRISRGEDVNANERRKREVGASLTADLTFDHEGSKARTDNYLPAFCRTRTESFSRSLMLLCVFGSPSYLSANVARTNFFYESGSKKRHFLGARKSLVP